MYPEGTWNLSPNLPMLPLFRGIADIAKETNATIIPFAQEIDDKSKTYYCLNCVKKNCPNMCNPLISFSLIKCR